ncbi:MAG: glycoside hydrolase family 70 protein [Streptococcus thermophilus]
MTLYVANSKSSGKDFQAQYGGEFLDELKRNIHSCLKCDDINW